MIKILYVMCVYSLLNGFSIAEDIDLSDVRSRQAYQKKTDEWWNDWIMNSNKIEFKPSKNVSGMTKYVSSIVNTNPEAYTWFFLTGGKYGFSKRRATDEEMDLFKNSCAVVINKTPSYTEETKYTLQSLFFYNKDDLGGYRKLFISIANENVSSRFFESILKYQTKIILGFKVFKGCIVYEDDEENLVCNTSASSQRSGDIDREEEIQKIKDINKRLFDKYNKLKQENRRLIETGLEWKNLIDSLGQIS